MSEFHVEVSIDGSIPVINTIEAEDEDEAGQAAKDAVLAYWEDKHPGIERHITEDLLEIAEIKQL